MKNPTIEQIHQHASVRHYKPEPLPTALVESVVAAGQRASTSSNLQAYSVVAVTDPDLRSQLSTLAANQAFIREAPCFLIWCADLSRLDRVCHLRGYTQVTEYFDNFLTAAMDVTLVAQNAALAAESLGLGICYVGALRDQLPDVIKLLDLPSLVVPVFGMTIGWIAKSARIKPRLPLASVLHWNRYDRTSEDENLLSYDATMAATGIYEGRQVPVPGSPGIMENYGWNEHVARRVSKAARQNMRSAVEQQGFKLK